MIFEKPPFESIIRAFSASIMLVNDDGSRLPRFDIIGGTMGFVCTPEARFIVTAKHVWTELSATLVQSSRAALCTHNAGNVVWLSGLELVSENEELDIAVLAHPFLDKLPLREQNQSSKSDDTSKACLIAGRWPMRPAIDGEELCLSGYPRQLRYSDSAGAIDCVSCFIEDHCSVSRGGTIYMASGVPRRQLNHQFGTPRMTNLGGISGSPVFAKRNGMPELVGIVRSAPVRDGSEDDTEDAANVMIRISPIDSLQANGRFN